MSDLDITQQFERNIAERLNKVASVQKASAEKTAQIASYIDATEGPNAKLRQLNEDSLVGQLGLDPNGIFGGAVNLGASLFDGTATLAKNIATTVPTLYAAAVDSNVPDAVKGARQRQIAGQATTEDLALLALPAGDVDANRRLTPYQKLARIKAAESGTLETNQQRIERMEGALKAASSVREGMDTSGVVHRGDQRALEADLRDGYQANTKQISAGWDKGGVSGMADVVSGIGGLIATIGEAAITNPKAAAEHVVTNVPQFAAAAFGGPLGMGLTNIPYAIEEFGKGIEAYKQANSGALPPDDVMAKLGTEAAALALAETGGDMIGVGLGRAAKATIGANPADDVLRANLKKALFGNGAARVAGAGIGSGAGEFVTEAYQTGIENSMQGKDTTGEDLFAGGSIGAISGSAASAGMRAMSEATGTTPEKIEERQVKATQQMVQEAAVATGDVTALVTPDSPTFAPDKAIAALYGNAKQADAAPEQEQDNYTKASTILKDLDAQIDEMTARANDASLTPEERKVAQVAVRRLNAEFDKAMDAMEVFTTESHKDIDLDAEISNVKAGQPEAAERILNLSMAIQERMTGEQALELANDANAALSDEQRDYLRQFAAARTEENKLKTMGKVSREIYSGSEPNSPRNYVGIAQYRARISQALLAGNKALADKHFAGLKAFSESHSNKAEVAQEALEMGGGAQIVRNKDGAWEIHTGERISDAELRKNGGLTINSQKLVNGIKTEAAALAQAVTEMEAARTVKTGVATKSKTQGAPNVQTQPQGSRDTGSAKQVRQELAPAGTPVQDQEAQADGSGTDDQATARQTGAAGSSVKDEATLKPAPKSEPKPLPKGDSVKQKIEKRLAFLNAADSKVTPVDAQENIDWATPLIDRVDGQIAATKQFDHNKNALEQLEQLRAELVDVVNAAQYHLDIRPEEGETDGTLDVFAQKSAKDAPYLERNLVADSFTQTANKEGAKTQRPLASVKDFLSQWMGKKLTVSETFLGIPEDRLNDAQKSALRSLGKYLKAWVPLFPANFKRDERGPASPFFAEDMMQFLYQESVDGKVDVEENVKTAMAYAAYSWLVGEARSPENRMKEEVLRMHGKQKEAHLSAAGYRELKNVSGFETKIINDLGAVAFQALGLKLKKDAPLDMEARLKNALGTHALELLKQQGHVSIKTKPKQEVEAYFDALADDETETDAASVTKDMVRQQKVSISYVTVKRDDRTAALKDAHNGAKNIIDDLFGVEYEPRIADTKPAKFVQKTAKGTNQEISKAQRDVVNATQQIPHKAIPEMLETMFQLGKDNLLKIAGFVDLDSAVVHKVNVDGIMAQNDNLEHQLDLMMEMLDDPSNPEGYDTEFYVQQSVWRNFRAGFTTQSLNQQTSKIHRYMFARPSWTATIELDNAAHTEELMVSIAQGLGVAVDKQKNAVTLEKLQAKLAADPQIMVAINGLMKLHGDGSQEMTAEETAAVTEVSANAEGMMTLQALVAYSKLEWAKAKGEKSVDITMLVGADGKTNGPMLTHLALGAAADVDGLYEVLNRGGMYATGDEQPKHFSEYYAANGSMDLYESLAKAILDVAPSFRKPLNVINAIRKMGKQGYAEAKKLHTPEAWDALQVLTGQLFDDKANKVTSAGRNLVKTPLTAFGFGSALTSSVRGMENKFIDNIYTIIEQMVAGDKKAPTPEAFYSALDTLAQFGDPNVAKFPRVPVKELLTGELMESHEKALRAAFQQVMGIPVKSAMESYFATFIERRTTLNNTLQAGFAAYETVYADARNREIMRLVETGDIAHRIDKNGNKVPLHDLSAKQEEAFRKQYTEMLPMVHTEYSRSENNLNAGLMMSKTTNSQSDNKMYHSKVMTAAGPVQSKAYTTREASPGVAGVPYMIHSDDSYGIHTAMAEVPESMNVHDEIGNGPLKIKDAANAINKATAMAGLNYSPPREAFTMLERLIINTAKRVASGSIDQKQVQVLFQKWFDIVNRNTKGTDNEMPMELVGNILLETAFRNANDADRVRLGAIAKMGNMDQYPWEGGQFEITEAIREQADNMLKDLPAKMPARVQHAMDYLTKVLEANAGQMPEVPSWIEQETEQDVAQDGQIVAGSTIAGLSGTTLATVAQTPLTPSTPVTTIQKIADAAKKIPKVLTSFWGELGQPTIQSDEVLVAFFEANPNPSFNEVIVQLRNRIAQQSGRHGEFNRQLLAVLQRTVGQDLKLHYVKPDTDSGIAFNAVMDKSRGWYSLKGSQEAVYFLSPDFIHSGLTVETVLHELVHAALAKTIHAPSAEAKPLVDELTTLMDKAKAYIGKNKLKGYDAAVSKVQEFVSWGMTNLGFQREVLSKVTMQPKNRKNALVTAAARLYELMTEILFRGSDRTRQAKLVNGMSVLVGNVSGLFYAAQQGTSPLNGEINLPMSAAAQAVNYTTQDIFTALDDGSLTPEFSGKLQGLLKGMVSKLHGSAGSLKDALMKNQALAPFDVWQKAMATGAAPFASALVGRIRASEQEMFIIEQVEATVRAALSGNEAPAKLAYGQLTKLYLEARKQLLGKIESFHAGDWATATQTDKDAAKALHDLLFVIKDEGGERNDYLARFAAVGLGHQQVNTLLQFSTDMGTVSQPKTFADRMQGWFEKVLEFFTSKVTSTFAGQRADYKLEGLVDQLVDIEAKKRLQLIRRQTAIDIFAPVEEGAVNLVEAGKQKLEQLAGSNWVRQHSSGLVKGAGGIVRTVAGNRVELFMDGLKQFRAEYIGNRQTLAATFINEFVGAKEKFQALLRMSKNNERIRKAIITNTAKTAMESFANNGRDLTKEMKAGITAVFMRTGMHSLLDHYDMAAIADIMTDKKKRDAAIADFEGQLSSMPKLQAYYIRQANALGYFRATGRVASPYLMMNAHNIANLFGTDQANKVNKADAAKAEAIIEALVSLYAIGYADRGHMAQASKVMAAEMARTDKGNGVEFVLKLHKQLEKESKERLFGGKQALMMHGYTPEIYNPHTEIKIANLEEGKQLELQGYVRHEAVATDQADPTKEVRHIYVMKDGGLAPYLTGIVSYTGMQAKGKKSHNGWMNVNSENGLENAVLQATIMDQKNEPIRKLFAPLTVGRTDLSSVQQTFMAPVVNEKGEVVNFRYLMQEKTKDLVLERDNRFEKVLGALAGSIFDKESTQEQNEKAILALRDQFEAEYATRKDEYVNVGPKSSDPELREIWDMLPKATKDAALKIWGKEGMSVRADSLDIFFGYRHLSLANAFDKDPESRNHFEKAFTWTVEWILENYARAKLGYGPQQAEEYAKRAALVVRRGENIWQEIVRETKDIFVVKSGVVMLGNIWSNWSLLALNGVPLKDMAHHHLIALKGATAYMRDSEELQKLTILKEAGHTLGDAAEIEQKILRLKDSLARNPVKELIDAGLMPTIVEDIAADDDIYSYKSAFTRKMDGQIAKLNPKIVTAAKTVYMAHDTKMYQGLSRITQLSDFVARYTLYQHLTTRKKNPMTKEEAAQRASESFVNYDIPMHRGLQYTDNMGLTMFTKYFLRIQPVLLRLARDNPARVLGALLLNQFMDLGPIVTDSGFINRIGNNPLSWGALQFPGAIDELGTVQASMALIK